MCDRLAAFNREVLEGDCRIEKSLSQETTMEMEIEGSCHCGAIAYEAFVDPKTAGLCHCTDCQTIWIAFSR